MSAVPTPSRADRRYRLAAHALLVIISILIIVPVAWVVMAAFKTKPESVSYTHLTLPTICSV